MYKILTAKSFETVLKVMAENGILSYLIEGVIIDFTLLERLSLLEQRFKLAIIPERRLAALLFEAKKESIDSTITRWRLENKDKDYLNKINYLKDTINIKINEKEIKQQIYKLGKDLFTELLVLKWAMEEKAELEESSLGFAMQLAENWVIPEFPLKGKDLLALGMKEGKAVGELLLRAEEWWCQQDYRPSKEEIINQVKKA
jgi:poly(A) polymerase